MTMPYTSLKGRPMTLCHCRLNFAGQIAEDLLGFVERADDRAGLPLVRGDPLVEFGELLGGKLIRGPFRYMMHVFHSVLSSLSFLNRQRAIPCGLSRGSEQNE